MSFFSSWSKQIYDYVTGYLPWGYIDTVNDSAIGVEKAEGGIRVTSTTSVGGQPTIIVVVIPQEAIEDMLKR